MITPITFEIEQLLKEKDFIFKQNEVYYNLVNGFTKYEEINPTIAEVVYWIYEKHKIWIEIGVGNLFHKDKFYILIKTYNLDRWDLTSLDNEIHSPYDSPTEAYLSAIEHTLKNIIK